MTQRNLISDLVKFDEQANEVTKVNWNKFAELEKLLNGIEFDAVEKADKDLSKCILYLLRTKVLSRNLEDNYVLTNDNSKRVIVSPNRDNVRYSFVRKEDAEEYAKINYSPEICSHLIISHYNSLYNLRDIDYEE